MVRVWIDGKAAALQAACAEAAKLLGSSRFPVIAGLGTDVAGARAAVALAERLGGAVDHMSSAALLRDIDVMRTSGTMVTTPSEARLRGDVLLLVGSGLLDAWPDLPRLLDSAASKHDLGRRTSESNHGQKQSKEAEDELSSTGHSDHGRRAPRRIIWLGPGRSAGHAIKGRVRIETVGAAHDLPALLAALRARVAGRPVGKMRLPANSLDALATTLKSARFGVALWSAGDLDALAIEMLCGLVGDLNGATRFSGLPLGPGDNARGVLETCGWMTGFPMRTGFGRGFPEHDPWRFDALRLIESGEADCVLWISAYRPAAPAWSRDVPAIVLTRHGTRFRAPPRVQFDVGCPGIDHGGVEHLAATGTLGFASARRASNASSVAEVLGAIASALPERGAWPC